MLGVFCWPDFVRGTQPSSSHGIVSSLSSSEPLKVIFIDMALADADEAAAVAKAEDRRLPSGWRLPGTG